MANLYLVCFKGDSIQRSIFDRLIRIFTKHKYTHVGLTTDISGDNITYYAARYDAGVREYTEPKIVQKEMMVALLKISIILN